MVVPQPDVLLTEFAKLGIALPDHQTQILQQYVAELERWNQRINLTALSGRKLIRRLVVEPVWAALQLKPGGLYLDVGSGTGAPAIPWHVVCSFTAAHLVEVRARKVAFLRHISAKLGLKNVFVQRARLENMVHPIQADWISLQGIALTPDRVDAMRKSLSVDTTRIVWITARSAQACLQPQLELDVPDSETKILVFRV